MADLSVRNRNESAQRMADAVLRATGGSTAMLTVSRTAGDSSDAGQLGIDAPSFQSLVIAPVMLQRVGKVIAEGQRARYELLVSATAMAEQVSLLQLASVDELLGLAAGVSVGGLNLLLEAWACTVNLGEPTYYRLAVRAAETQPQSLQS